MKHAWIILVGALGLTSFALAGPDKKPEGQGAKGGKGGMPEFLKKYDTDNDGRLSQEERQSVSQEDRAKVRKMMEAKGKGGKGGEGKGGKGGKPGEGKGGKGGKGGEGKGGKGGS